MKESKPETQECKPESPPGRKQLVSHKAESKALRSQLEQSWMEQRHAALSLSTVSAVCPNAPAFMFLLVAKLCCFCNLL